MAKLNFMLVFLAVSACKGIFIGGEQDVGSPLRVAQCRATCLERVSSLPCCVCVFFVFLSTVFDLYCWYTVSPF